MTRERNSPELVDQSDGTSERAADAASGSLLLGADSEATPTVSVVLPTLNEEEGIGDCIDRITTAVEELDVQAEIIVADSSTDRTPAIARSLGAIVVEPEKRGYGRAYRAGFEHARGRYVVMGDADTTYDFTAIPRLLEPVVEGEADICLGSRFAGRIEPGAMPALHRYVGNPLLTAFLNVFYDAGVSDAHSGFRVVSREALDRLDLQSDGMEFASEMVMAASAQGLEIAEIPITYHERTGEETLDSFRDGWRHVKFMLVNAPGYLFSLPGSASMLVGAAIMALSLLGVTVGGVVFGLHTMVGGSLLTVVGYQVLCFGLFSAVAAEPIRQPREPLTGWIRHGFRLEHGVLAGLVLTLGGGLGVTYLSVAGLRDGGPLPSAAWTLLASTVVILGVLTVFSSFFMSMIAGDDTP